MPLKARQKTTLRSSRFSRWMRITTRWTLKDHRFQQQRMLQAMLWCLRRTTTPSNQTHRHCRQRIKIRALCTKESRICLPALLMLCKQGLCSLSKSTQLIHRQMDRLFNRLANKLWHPTIEEQNRQLEAHQTKMQSTTLHWWYTRIRHQPSQLLLAKEAINHWSKEMRQAHSQRSRNMLVESKAREKWPGSSSASTSTRPWQSQLWRC